MTEEEYKSRYLHLVDLIRRMRGYQREFFKYRNKDDLERAKRLEREADKIIGEEIKVQKSNQTELF